jgi:hypothetical protein
MSRTKVVPVLAVLALVSLMISLGAALADNHPGTVRIMDTGDGLSNSAWITFDQAPALAPDQAYEGWLVNAPEGPPVSTGILVPDANGNINQAYVGAGENLLGTYNTFVISMEPVPDPAPAAPSDVKPYAHGIPAGALAHIRHVVYSWRGNPVYTSGFYSGQDLPKGIVVGLRDQTADALKHAGFSAGAGNIGGVHTHAGHVINILEGPGGANYDEAYGYDGDGFGAFNYAADMKHAGFAASAAPDDATVVQNANEALDSTAQSKAWAEDARDNAILALGTDDYDAARLFIGNAVSLLDRALNGMDADGDGTIGRKLGEGGAKQAYEASQDMGTFTIGGAAPSGPKLPEAGDSSVPYVALMALVLGVLLLVGGSVVFRVSGRRA